MVLERTGPQNDHEKMVGSRSQAERTPHRRAVKRGEKWRIALYQNTPAQFHQRPDLVRQMTEELRQLLP